MQTIKIGEDFMLKHGYIKNDFDIEKWTRPEFLKQAATEVLKEKWKKEAAANLKKMEGLKQAVSG